MFWKKKVSKWVDKMDKIITWIVIWWAVASMFWLAKKNKKTGFLKKIWNLVLKKSLSWFSSVLVKTISILSKKK